MLFNRSVLLFLLFVPACLGVRLRGSHSSRQARGQNNANSQLQGAGNYTEGNGDDCDEGCSCLDTEVRCNGRLGLRGFPAAAVRTAERLDIDCDWFIKIPVLHVPLFYHRLQELRISACGVESIDHQSFVKLSNLKKITLKRNKITSIGRGIFRGLRDLSHLNLAYNEIDDIPRYAFIAARSLESLDLSNNRIRSIKTRTFRGLDLKELDLSNNPSLRTVANGAFYNSNITTLDISGCNFTANLKNILRPLRNSLRALYWSNNNQPVDLPEDFFEGFVLKEVKLMNNTIRNLAFLKHLQTDKLHLESNHIREVDFNLYPLMNYTRFLYLTNNRISDISGDRLNNLYSLKVLRLNGNLIRTLANSKMPIMQALMSLDLAENQLKTLPPGIFQNMSLSSLDLAGNELQFLNASMFNLESYMWNLDLSHNNLTTLSENLRPLISRCFRVSLFRNPMHCNCELKWLYTYVSETKHWDFSISCATPVQRIFSEMSISDFNCSFPVISDVISNVQANGRVVLTCSGRGEPVPTMTLYNNNGDILKIASNEGKIARKNENEVSLELPSSQEPHRGVFVCKANNVEGAVESTLHLHVLPRPGC